MRKAFQYRWIKNNKEANSSDIYPPAATIESFFTGSAFADRTPIYQLGIQALPGTKFYLNGGIDPIVVGATGIYELDLQEKAIISALRFDAESMLTIKEMAENTGNGFLIVDIVYEGEED